MTSLPGRAAFRWLEDRAYNVYSQFGEDGILAAIFEKLGTCNKWVLECGASDGVFFSNSRKLIEEGWFGVLVEADPAQFEKLTALYASTLEAERVQLFQHRVSSSEPGGLDVILSAANAPRSLDLAIIDVDGQDYWLFNSLLKHRPQVVMVEYDPNAPVDFVPPINGEGQAGKKAIIDLGVGKLYWPVAMTTTNIIFVQQELAHTLAEPVDEPNQCQSWSYAEPFNPKSKGVRCPNPAVEGGTHCADHVGQTAEIQPRVAAVMSTPRIGFLSTMDCIGLAIHRLGMSWFRGEGAFWSHALTRGIESAIKSGHNLIVTIDYDSIFEHEPTNNAIAKLICLMMDNPDVDVIVAGQMKREGGPLLATTRQEVKLLEPLIPIQQGHFGLTIFRASVFDRLKKPWFYEQPNEHGEWNENRIDADIGFWKNCEEANINVQMSLDVLIGHLELVVTWPGQDLKPVYQPINNWRDIGKPSEAFDRQRVLAAVRANPALLYSPKLEMGG